MIKTNIAWNFLGGILPLLVGVIVFPLIISAYGIERFGLLAIAWSLVGYFSLFDMGLSRALTQVVSEKLSKDADEVEIVELVYTAFRIMFLLGVFGGVFLWLITPWLVTHALSVTVQIEPETIRAFTVLAISIPFVVHTSALRGVMDALHLFKQANLIRLVLGIGTFLGPYLSSFYGPSLEYAAYSLILVRLLGWLMHYVVVKRTPLLKNKTSSFRPSLLRPLFAFGGWMTISNIIGPLMVYLDRFVIAAMLGTASVAFYVAPYEVITKLWVVPAAISGVLYPLFAKDWQINPKATASILNKGMVYVLMILYPAILIASVFAEEWLNFWLGKEFAVNGASLVPWLAAGVLINSMAQILFAKVQGAGRADWTAKLHLAEAIPYWLFLWIALENFGIKGAAMAWFFRVTIDFFGLAYATNKINIVNKKAINVPMALACLAIFPVVASIYIESLSIKLILVIIIALIYCKISLAKLRYDGAFAYIKNIIRA